MNSEVVHRLFQTAILLGGLHASVLAQSLDGSGQLEGPSERTAVIRFEIPRLSLEFGHASLADLPASVRDVGEFSRRSNRHTLPINSGGTLGGGSIGAGVLIAQRIELAYDFAVRNSGGGGRTTWSEIGFPSDDYVGYKYEGLDSTFSAAYRIAGNCFARSGIRVHHKTVSSGADAFGQFWPENSVDINRRSLVFGGGYRVWTYDRFAMDLSFDVDASGIEHASEQYFQWRLVLVPWSLPVSHRR